MVSWGISPFPPKSHGIGKTEGAACVLGITAEKWSGFQRELIIHEIGKRVHGPEHQLSETDNKKQEEILK